MSKRSVTLSKELIGLLLLAFSLISLLGLISFSPLGSHENLLGLVGHGIGWVLRFSLGLASYLLIGALFLVSFRLLSKETIEDFPVKALIFTILLFSVSLLFNLFAEAFPEMAIYAEKAVIRRKQRVYLGGVPTYFLFKDLPFMNLEHLLSRTGNFLVFFAIAIAAALELTAWKPAHFLMAKIKSRLLSLKDLFKPKTLVPALEEVSVVEVPSFPPRRQEPFRAALPPTPIKKPQREKLEPEPIIQEKPKLFSKPKVERKPVHTAPPRPVVPVKEGDFVLPPLSLLTAAKVFDTSALQKELGRQAHVLEETLLSFGIEAKVGQISCGPTIISFEVHPAIGVKVQKIKALENDIALNLQAKSIRILAPIPGKACVGIEIPSPRPQEVGFKEMLEAYEASGKHFNIPIFLGKTVSGDDVMSDLTRMPHCIIAGATGSGKSVCINTMVMSILMTAKPDEVRLVMVDPKKVELTAYSELPHMLAPVITEPKGAAAALHYLVREMEKRYEILKKTGCRNLLGFNNRLNKENAEDIPEKMPYIVAIIDELADLMISSSQDIETPIARIAQMARAVGIHLILATQRPSREVITGLIKANFPTRIAFKVASRVNSQIILDEIGAESLLGNGDMLFLPPGTSILTRAQGAFIRDEDITRVIDFISKQRPPSYQISSFDNFSPEERKILQSVEDDEDSDSLYEEALEIVQTTGNASTTFLQRKLKIGYARAASLMDLLEQRGIIGPQEGAKPRKVLVFKEMNVDLKDEG